MVDNSVLEPTTLQNFALPFNTVLFLMGGEMGNLLGCEGRVHDREEGVVVAGVDEGGDALGGHPKIAYFVALSVQVLSTLKRKLLKPLPNKRQQPPVPQPLKKRVCLKRLPMDTHHHSDSDSRW